MIILKSIFGSKLYGTSVPTSDTDVKIIFLPSLRDVILQKSNNVPKEDLFAPTETIKDIEYISLHKYMHLLCTGQTMALDLLFTPKEYILQSSPIWEAIVSNKLRFINKGVAAMLGYAKAQSYKYSKKGQRYNEVSKLLNRLKIGFVGRETFTLNHILCHADLAEFEFISFCEIEGANKQMEKAIDVLGKKFALHHRKEYIIEQLESLAESYGERAKEAARFEEKDWKALYHAVRIGEEAKELLTTGAITFPRPEAQLLLDIRLEKIPFKLVSELIDNNLAAIEKLMTTSHLQSKPDKEFAEQFIYDSYTKG